MTSYLRYKKELRTVQDADDIESWITVRGNHIPIKKGQSKEEAVKSFLEHQAGKNDLPQGTKWSPTNKKGEGTGNKSAPKKEKYDIRHGASIQNIENMINAHADKKAYKSWKEEEEYVAEKLKEEGIYAYGNQIKEAMKNVYGDNYTKERNEESSKKWSGAWSKRANKPVTLGEASKNATSISKMTKMSASERDEKVGFPMLEIAYSDVKFTEDPEKNRSELSKAIKESGHENADLMQSVLSGLSNKELKDADSVRKGIRDYMKSYNKEKKEQKPESSLSKKTEFEQTFGNSSWNAHKDWASYVDKDYRIEVIKENGGYYISKFDIDDYDGSDPEMEEYADTIEEAKQVAEKMINKSQPMSKEDKMRKVAEARNIVGGSVRFEKEGKNFVITGYYTGKEVKFDFEKLTGHSPNESVEYSMKGDILTIRSYYGRWEKEIDFSKIDDEDLAEMIKG